MLYYCVQRSVVRGAMILIYTQYILIYLIYTAYDGPLQYNMSQTYTDVGPYAERKNSEGMINGNFFYVLNYSVV